MDKSRSSEKRKRELSPSSSATPAKHNMKMSETAPALMQVGMEYVNPLGREKNADNYHLLKSRLKANGARIRLSLLTASFKIWRAWVKRTQMLPHRLRGYSVCVDGSRNLTRQSAGIARILRMKISVLSRQTSNYARRKNRWNVAILTKTPTWSIFAKASTRYSRKWLILLRALESIQLAAPEKPRRMKKSMTNWLFEKYAVLAWG